MALRNHGAHLIPLTLPALAAGTASDTGVCWTFNAYAAQGAGSTANPTTGSDSTVYQVREASLTSVATLTGAATNFCTFLLQQFNSAGTKVNEISIAFSAAGVVLTANKPANLNVASGATVPNAGTGTLANGTGVVLPWTLNNGDQIVLARTSAGTGLASPGVGITFLVGQKDS